MFKELYNEATLTLRIEPDGPLLIKAGESGVDPTRPDMEFVRTTYQGRETIYLPGSSLKGVIRAHCERLARTLQPDGITKKLSDERLSCDPLDDEFSCGRLWERERRGKNVPSTEEIYRRSCFICRLFGNTSLASRIRISDAYPDDLDGVKTEERNGVAIDRVFGSVAAGPFNYEVATSGTFICRIQLRNFSVAQLGLLALALRDLEMQRISIGFGKSRGLGRVKAHVTQITVRYPACSLNGTLTLLGSSKPGTLPNQMPGAGVFVADGAYGLDDSDIATLPEGVALTADEWGEPRVSLSEDGAVKTLLRECAKSWQRFVEQVVTGK